MHLFYVRHQCPEVQVVPRLRTPWTGRSRTLSNGNKQWKDVSRTDFILIGGFNVGPDPLVGSWITPLTQCECKTSGQNGEIEPESSPSIAVHRMQRQKGVFRPRSKSLCVSRTESIALGDKCDVLEDFDSEGFDDSQLIDETSLWYFYFK